MRDLNKRWAKNRSSARALNGRMKDDLERAVQLHLPAALDKVRAPPDVYESPSRFSRGRSETGRGYGLHGAHSAVSFGDGWLGTKFTGTIHHIPHIYSRTFVRTLLLLFMITLPLPLPLP